MKGPGRRGPHCGGPTYASLPSTGWALGVGGLSSPAGPCTSLLLLLCWRCLAPFRVAGGPAGGGHRGNGGWLGLARRLAFPRPGNSGPPAVGALHQARMSREWAVPGLGGPVWSPSRTPFSASLSVKKRIEELWASAENLQKEVGNMYNMEVLRLPVALRELSWLSYLGTPRPTGGRGASWGGHPPPAAFRSGYSHENRGGGLVAALLNGVPGVRYAFGRRSRGTCSGMPPRLANVPFPQSDPSAMGVGGLHGSSLTASRLNAQQPGPSLASQCQGRLGRGLQGGREGVDLGPCPNISVFFLLLLTCACPRAKSHGLLGDGFRCVLRRLGGLSSIQRTGG